MMDNGNGWFHGDGVQVFMQMVINGVVFGMMEESLAEINVNPLVSN